VASTARFGPLAEAGSPPAALRGPESPVEGIASSWSSASKREYSLCGAEPFSLKRESEKRQQEQGGGRRRKQTRDSGSKRDQRSMKPIKSSSPNRAHINTQAELAYTAGAADWNS
jgi:hypothetical protein